MDTHITIFSPPFLIQIQHLLKLNRKSLSWYFSNNNSNTTLVKVKLQNAEGKKKLKSDSNTTLVKVK